MEGAGSCDVRDVAQLFVPTEWDWSDLCPMLGFLLAAGGSAAKKAPPGTSGIAGGPAWIR